MRAAHMVCVCVCVCASVHILSLPTCTPTQATSHQHEQHAILCRLAHMHAGTVDTLRHMVSHANHNAPGVHDPLSRLQLFEEFLEWRASHASRRVAGGGGAGIVQSKQGKYVKQFNHVSSTKKGSTTTNKQLPTRGIMIGKTMIKKSAATPPASSSSSSPLAAQPTNPPPCPDTQTPPPTTTTAPSPQQQQKMHELQQEVDDCTTAMVLLKAAHAHRVQQQQQQLEAADQRGALLKRKLVEAHRALRRAQYGKRVLNGEVWAQQTEGILGALRAAADRLASGHGRALALVREAQQERK